MNKLTPKKIVLIVFLIAFTLRAINLEKSPPSLDWDEVSNTYNAYSIAMTGKDEYGNFLPLANRSFDDYKPPLYMYLQVPFVLVFGLGPLAARLPSAIFGSFTVIVFYFLAKKLFEESKHKDSVATVASLLLATSPWHLQFSRVGFEANIGLFTTTAAVTAFLYGLTNRKWFLASGFLFSISFYAYHSQRVFMPFIFIVLVILWRKELLSLGKRHIGAFLIISLVTIAPLALLAPREAFLKRFQQSSGEATRMDYESSIKLIRQDKDKGFPLTQIHNRRLIQAQTFISNYLSNFDPNFFFREGDNNFRHHIEQMGMLFLFQLPLTLLGIFLLLRSSQKRLKLILFWLAIAPVSAALVSPSPHAVRAYLMVIPLELASAYSLVFLSGRATRKVLVLLVIWGIASSVIYLHNYWTHYPRDKASFWQYGYREAVFESEKLKNQFEKITVDNSIEQAYIFWLFYTKYNPSVYQQIGSRYHFDRYYFTPQRPTNPKELFISDAPNFPKGFEVVKTINYPDGQPAVIIGHPQ